MAQIFDSEAWARKTENTAYLAVGGFGAPDHNKISEKELETGLSNLSAEFQSLSPTQLKLVIDQMQRNHSGLALSVDSDPLSGNIRSVEFHGRNNIAVEAGSGKLFNREAEAIRLTGEIEGAFANQPDQLKRLKEHFQSMDSSELRMVVDTLQHEGNPGWSNFSISRTPDGDVLGFDISEGNKRVSIDATSGKVFDSRVPATACLMELGNIFRNDATADSSKVVLPYLLGSMSKGERELVVDEMHRRLAGYGFIEKTWSNQDLSGLRFVADGKQLVIDLNDAPRFELSK